MEKYNIRESRSRLDFFKDTIVDLVCRRGLPVSSAWKYINADLPEHSKISRSLFISYAKKNGIRPSIRTTSPDFLYTD